jgi:transketolase
LAAISIREAYGRALADYGALNPRLVVVDADTSSSTLTHFFARRFPERFFNIGIAEPCMVDVGVGLALGGLVPFVNGFAALLALRSIEAIRTNVCYARANVKIAASYAGLSDYKDGPTHHSITDIAMLRALPDITVIVPADPAEAAAWVPVVAEYDGPVYLRINRAGAIPVYQPGSPLIIGKGLTLRPGNDLTIIAAGTMVGRSLLAAERLAVDGIQVRVINMHTIKPLDEALILQAARETGAIVTAEEGTIIGGLGSAVAETLAEGFPTPMVRVGIHDQFCRTAPDPETLMDASGLSVEDLISACHRVYNQKP